MLRTHYILVAALVVLAVRHESTTFAPSFTVMTPAAPAAPPQTIVLPAPVAAAADRPSCPPPRTDAPFVAPTLPEPIDHVQAAPSNAGWIVAWNKDHVFASYDAGATFQRALDGDGEVQDASFDCFGHLAVTRGHRVGVRDGASEKWHAVPGLRANDGDAAGVLGGGPDIVVAGNLPGDGWNVRLAVSADLGRTFTYHDLGDGLERSMRYAGREHEDGSIDAATSIGDCMNDDLIWSRVKDGEVDRVMYGMPEGTSFGIYGDVALDDSAWFARDGARHELPEEARGDPLTVVRGAFPTIVAGDKTYRLTNGKLRDLHLVVEGDPQVVDLAGRIWSVDCGHALVAKRTPTNLLCGD